MRWSRVISLVAAMAVAAVAHAAIAGSLGVSPLRIGLSDASPTAALTIENGGSNAVVVQLQVMRWFADGEADRYEPGEEIIATPPIMTIAPGQPQIVRVGLSGAADPGREVAYRLYMEEVPSPPQPGQQGLQVALRIGVPIFVSPPGATQSSLDWRARRTGPDSVTVRATNRGGSHAKLMSLRLADGNRTLAEQQIAGYLLPGQTRQWLVRLSEAFAGERLRLSTETDRGETNTELALEDR